MLVSVARHWNAFDDHDGDGDDDYSCNLMPDCIVVLMYVLCVLQYFSTHSTYVTNIDIKLR